MAYWSGYDKIFDADARQAYADLLQESGIAATILLTLLLGVIELFGSLFLAAGFFTRRAAGLLLLAGSASAAIQLLVLDQPISALFTFHHLRVLGIGYYLVAFLLLFVLGPGRISFDAGRRTMHDEDD